MNGLENITQVDSKERKKREEPLSMESPHKNFLFETESATFSVLFKPQEEMVPLSAVEKKSVVFVGDTPLEKLREAGKDARAEFVINSDAQSIIHAARLLAKTYPEARRGEPYRKDLIKTSNDKDSPYFPLDGVIRIPREFARQMVKSGIL